jgi:hypothetical protein
MTCSIPIATVRSGPTTRNTASLEYFAPFLRLSGAFATLRSHPRFTIQCVILPFTNPTFDSREFPRKLLVREHPIRQQVCIYRIMLRSLSSYYRPKSDSKNF